MKARAYYDSLPVKCIYKAHFKDSDALYMNWSGYYLCFECTHV